MRPRRTVQIFSWVFMVLGLLGLLGALLDSSIEPTSPIPGLTLVTLAMAGFGLLAYLDTKA